MKLSIKNFQFLKTTFLFVVILISLFYASKANAARVFFEPAGPLEEGSIFSTKLLIDPEGESINAVEGSIELSGPLEIIDVKVGNSIINFWIEEPNALEKSFSGVIPGGFDGAYDVSGGNLPGEIFTILLRGTREGQGSVNVSGVKALVNDGKGTEARTITSSLQILISGKENKKTQITKVSESQEHATLTEDSIPPEPFSLQLGRSETIFEGDWFVAFSTQDKQSRIAYYEIKEGSRGFVRAVSPYRLEDQSLRSEIVVKAVDNFGNEREASISATRSGLSYSNVLFLLLIFLGLSFLFLRKKNLWFLKK